MSDGTNKVSVKVGGTRGITYTSDVVIRDENFR